MSLKKYMPSTQTKAAFHITFLKKFFIFKRDIKKFCFFKILVPIQYKKACLKPLQEDKVIFLEISAEELSNSDRLLYNTLISKYNLDVHVHFLLKGRVSQNELYRRQQAFLKDAATAKYLIYNDSYNFTGALKKRKGQHIINLWHGAGAFKKFGFSIAEKKFGMDRDEMRRFPLHPKYDIVTVSSPEVRWAYIEAMGKEKEADSVKALGISRTDIFYDKDFALASKNRLYEIFPNAKGKKIILYAPTFRGHVNTATSPDMLNIRSFKEHLGKDYVLLFNHHPFVKKPPEIPYDLRDFAIDLTGLMSIDELITVTDICISDYSSLIFEYSLFEKPMIFYAYDLANYFDWRGFYYDYKELTPGPICYTNKEMLDYITHIDERFDKAKVKAFREKYMASCDGHATERIIREFFEESIEKYKRDTPLSGDFTSIPDSSKPYYDYTNLMSFLTKVRNEVKKTYDKEKLKPIVKGRVLLILDEYSDTTVFHNIIKLAPKYKNLELIDDFSKNDLNLKEYISKLATAEVVLSAGEPYILRMIDVREDTKVIQILPEVISAFKSWNNKKERLISYNRYDCINFPIHSEYDEIITSFEDKNNTNPVTYNYRLKNNGQINMIGNIYTDMFFDKAFVKHSKEHIEALIPESKDKKKILFLCKNRPGLGSMLSHLLTEIYEEYASSHICIVKTSDASLIPEYLQGFAVSPKLRVLSNRENLDPKNLSENDYRIKNISEIRLLSAADIIVSDYVTKAFSVLSTGKKLILYTPDIATFPDKAEALIDYEEEFGSLIARNTNEFITRLNESEEVSKANADLIKNKYLSCCDGKAGKRLLEHLSI